MHKDEVLNTMKSELEDLGNKFGEYMNDQFTKKEIDPSFMNDSDDVVDVDDSDTGDNTDNSDKKSEE